MEFCGHGVTGIYEMNERIAFVHFAFGIGSEIEAAKRATPNYVLLDICATLASIRDQRLPTNKAKFS